MPFFKLRTFLFTLTVLWLLVFVSLPAIAESLLRVEVTNIGDHSGKQVYVRIYDESGFPQTPLLQQRKPAKSESLTFEFKLSGGSYAISVFHDLNDNGKLDRRFYGAPKEPAAFSNDYTPFGPPRFSGCAIPIRAGENKAVIRLED